MRNIIFYIWIFVCYMVGGGCSDFLEEYSRDQVYASSCKDLDEALIGNGYMESRGDGKAPGFNDLYYGYLFALDDDAEEHVAMGWGSHNPSFIPQVRNTATWQKNPYLQTNTGEDSEDKTVEKLYAHIAYVNTIMSTLDEFPNDPIEDRKRILGECQFLRAAYYLMLSNLYGWAYDVKNNGADLSVPLKTTEWIVEDKFSRATVGEVYRVIERDLIGACANLRGVEQKNFYRTNQLAARTLLSRVYLYMERYDEVITQCDSALNMGLQMLDLNNFFYDTEWLDERDYLYMASNPEIVFTMGYATVQDYVTPATNDYGNTSLVYSASQSLIDEYRVDAEVLDLRFRCYFERHWINSDRFGVVKNYSYEQYWEYPVVFDSFLIRTVEIYLNKAEAQAMKGDLAGAIATLQPLFDTRYAPEMQPKLSSSSEKELVNFIRSERRRELCFEGHRWPDLRRYAVNTKYPLETTIRHMVYETENGEYAGYYLLKPYGTDNGWIMPFGSKEISYSEGVLENPDRPERPNEDPNFRRE